MENPTETQQSNWFVGASFGDSGDQTSRFLSEGIWETNDPDKFLDLIRSMRPGDRIAIKSSYTRKHGMAFNNRDHAVSVMAIKATGIITEIPDSSKYVRVNWYELDEPREWFFFTNQKTIWCVPPGNWMANALLEFTFEKKPQDIDRFCNEPYWKKRFGIEDDNDPFLWTSFYETIANKLLEYRFNRKPLIAGIHEIASRVDGVSQLNDQFTGDRRGPLDDICPFTVMGIFNRGIKNENRIIIANELADFLDIDKKLTSSFVGEGIPVLNNQKSWFFGYAKIRKDDDIEALWKVFSAAANFVTDESPSHRTEFIGAYNEAMKNWGVSWNLSMGLYWSCPWNFLPLDSKSRYYIENALDWKISFQKPLSADVYLQFIDDLKERFYEEHYPVHSFPELSRAAWSYDGRNAASEPGNDEDVTSQVDENEKKPTISSFESYSIDKLMNEGCFFSSDEIERLLQRLHTKKNLILQGPPGTGKTWLAKRLAFALMGERAEKRIRSVQFHPNLSYEDFVRGWRPSGDGTLSLTNGVFMEVIHEAYNNSKKYVVVIEEINRGNPAQIFGEMLTLLEASKRNPNDALELCYPDPESKERESVYIPDNLYIIGTMNIADRSLALIDFAFRRRFAFAALEPQLNAAWRDWIVNNGGVDRNLVSDIERRINYLNQKIENDLGTSFRIGHSYVTPTDRIEIGSTRDWFDQVAKTEIGPLLEEYWFDSPKTAREALDALLKDW